MGKHGTRKQSWILVLWLVSVSSILAAIILVITIDPQWGTHIATCRYAAARVTVSITGPDCNAIMRQVTDNSDVKWISVKKESGEEFAHLSNGKDVLSIHDAGNINLARALAIHFQMARWRPPLPSP